jgi:hypothetical protein
VNPLAGINHLDLDDARLAAADALDGMNAVPPIADEPRVYELSQCFPLVVRGRLILFCLQRQ